MLNGYRVLGSETGFQNEQMVIKKLNKRLSKSFKLNNTHLFIDDFDISIYELYTRWSQK